MTIENQFMPLGAEFRVNTYTQNGQGSPSVAALADGGFVVSWLSWEQDGSSYGVYAQRYDASGAAVGAELRVNTHTQDWQEYPSVAALADGGFVVSWDSWGQDGSWAGVYAQRYDASGAAVGAEFRVNTFTESSQAQAGVAALTDGGFVVSWTSYEQDGSSNGIYAQRYDASGTAVGAELRVNTYTLGSQECPSVAALADGGFVVSWDSYGQDGSDCGVYAQRYDASGAAVGAEFRVNRDYPSVADLADGGYVAALADGGFVVSYGDSSGVCAQRYDALGAAVGAKFRVSNGTSPRVAALADGGFVVSWTSYEQDGSDSGGVYAQCYDASGTAVGAEFRVNTYTHNLQSEPSVAALADGGFLVSWESDGQDGSSYGVYAQRYELVAMNSLYGTNLPDQLSGGAGRDWLEGKGEADLLWGFAGGDALIGGAGADTLDGGAGPDLMSGGAGDDRFWVDDPGDRVIEDGNGGTDEVRASLTFQIPANVERLVLIGDAPLEGTGNEVGDILLGNGAGNLLQGLLGNDTLSGGDGRDRLVGGLGDDLLEGGAGYDRLRGGGGADGFVFQDPSRRTVGLDTIVDFKPGRDKIRLDGAGFSFVTVNRGLTADEFRSGAGIDAAADADDRLLYDTSTGSLYFDPDGTGPLAARRFAVLGWTEHPLISHQDIFITG